MHEINQTNSQTPLSSSLDEGVLNPSDKGEGNLNIKKQKNTFKGKRGLWIHHAFHLPFIMVVQ